MSRLLLTLAFVFAFFPGAGCSTFAKQTRPPAKHIAARQPAATTAPPGERYFVLIWGSQSTPKQPKYTHTWATVVKVTGCDGSNAQILEEQTISWMPATLDIRAFSRHVE